MKSNQRLWLRASIGILLGTSSFNTYGGDLHQNLSVDTEGAAEAPDQAMCEKARSALIASGLIVPEATGCVPTNYDTPNRADFLFYTKGKSILRGFPIDPESCKFAVRAISSTVFNDQGMDHPSGYCESVPEQPGKQRVVLDSVSKNNGTDSLIFIKNLSSCDQARNAIVDSGLTLEFRPGVCSIPQVIYDGAPPAGTAKIELSIEHPYIAHLYRGRTLISKEECETARTSLTAFLLENDKKMGQATLVASCSQATLVAACEQDADPSMARLTLTTGALPSENQDQRVVTGENKSKVSSATSSDGAFVSSDSNLSSGAMAQ